MTQISLALWSSSPHSLKHGGPGSRPPLQLEMETYRDFYQVGEAVWRREGRIILDVKQWTRIILFPARPCSQVDCHTMCCLTALIFTAGLQMWILIRESVDSLCRDGTDTPYTQYKIKVFKSLQKITFKLS